MPDVTVVIPTYYRNGLLKGAIESVLAQTHPHCEIIVVDGSGEAHARPVVEAYDDVRFLPQEIDKGPHAARSEGAIEAHGDYVNFLDDDDRLHPEKLERQLDVAARSDAGVIYCGAQWEDGHRVLPDPSIRGDVLEAALRFRMTPASPSAMLIDAEILSKVLPFQNHHGADDMGLKIELARRTSFEFVDEVLVTNGLAEDSLSRSWDNVAGRFELLERYADLYEDYPTVYRDAVAHTYLLRATLLLEERPWSLQAIIDVARACYLVPGLPLAFAGFLVTAPFGRPGVILGWKVYNRLVLGDEHRGKIT